MTKAEFLALSKEKQDEHLFYLSKLMDAKDNPNPAAAVQEYLELTTSKSHRVVASQSGQIVAIHSFTPPRRSYPRHVENEPPDYLWVDPER